MRQYIPILSMINPLDASGVVSAASLSLADQEARQIAAALGDLCRTLPAGVVDGIFPRQDQL